MPKVFDLAEVSGLIPVNELADSGTVGTAVTQSNTTEELVTATGIGVVNATAERFLYFDGSGALSELDVDEVLALVDAAVVDVDAGTLDSDFDIPWSRTASHAVISGERTVTGVQNDPVSTRAWIFTAQPETGAVDSLTFDPTAFYPLTTRPADMTTDPAKSTYYYIQKDGRAGWPLYGYAKLGDV